jgi:hypothetical protein
MGYTTEFVGSITVDPPLSLAEVNYLKKFAESRRMDCEQGPYYVHRSGFYGQDNGPDVRNYNEPPAGQPGLWCKWESTPDGTAIEWNGDEKFYDASEWMQYLIDHFIGPDPHARKELPFLTGHNCNGEIEAQGEDRDDRWKLVVKDNRVSVRRAMPTKYEEDEPTVIEGEYEDISDKKQIDNQRLLR